MPTATSIATAFRNLYIDETDTHYMIEDLSRDESQPLRRYYTESKEEIESLVKLIKEGDELKEAAEREAEAEKLAKEFPKETGVVPRFIVDNMLHLIKCAAEDKKEMLKKAVKDGLDKSQAYGLISIWLQRGGVCDTVRGLKTEIEHGNIKESDGMLDDVQRVWEVLCDVQEYFRE